MLGPRTIPANPRRVAVSAQDVVGELACGVGGGDGPLARLAEQRIAGHRVEGLADRALVLRDGEVSGTLAREEIDHDAMVRLMVGRDVSLADRPTARRDGAAILSVKGLRTATWPSTAVRAWPSPSCPGAPGQGAATS